MNGLFQEILASIAQDQPLLRNSMHCGELPGERAVETPLEIARVVEEELRLGFAKGREAFGRRAITVLVPVEQNGGHEFGRF
jgi:hypothetical protein